MCKNLFQVIKKKLLLTWKSLAVEKKMKKEKNKRQKDHRWRKNQGLLPNLWSAGSSREKMH